MQELEDLPVLVLELIVTFLDYSGHIALLQTNSYFKKLVEGLVIKEVVLPNNRICQFNLRKPVMRLIVNMPFDSNNVMKTNETLTDFAGELCQFNVVKTGDLTIKLSSDNDATWPAVTRIYYHLLMILILESKLKPNSIKRLEIQLDFLCDQCRKFLEKLPGILIFTSLERLKVNCINYNDTPTVGLYVHFLKMIFNFAPLKSFELSNIPESIYEELKAWFMPGNMYFSQIRQFEFYTKPLTGNCLLFLFGDLLIENLH
eukprot:TRINITY_DN2829_c0_g2_i1.p1 TRINITY_DN2829_c0_g2~~TRINITY_DN2829_c0_g2_i1.p1  ORF type:complete len:259 (-),score=49.68 TRINITY_DN2829_c0_g2_i1:55-831(-)